MYIHRWNPFRLLRGLKSATCSNLEVKYFTVFMKTAVKNVQTPFYQATFPAAKDPRAGWGAIHRLLPVWGHIQHIPADRVAQGGHCTLLTLALNFAILQGAETRHCLSGHYCTLHLISTPWPGIAHKAGWLKDKFSKKALSKGTCLCQTLPDCSAHLPGLLFKKTKANITLAGIPPSLYLSKSSAMFLI